MEHVQRYVHESTVRWSSNFVGRKSNCYHNLNPGGEGSSFRHAFIHHRQQWLVEPAGLVIVRHRRPGIIRGERHIRVGGMTKPTRSAVA